jgi:hypothetical protein
MGACSSSCPSPCERGARAQLFRLTGNLGACSNRLSTETPVYEMPRFVRRPALLPTALLLLTTAPLRAAAAEPPKDLYGKSIVVGWNEDRVQRRDDQKNFRNVTVRGGYVVYVSDEGRLFNRVTMENPRGKKGKKDRLGDTERRFTEFDGDKMVATQKMAVGGARQITVTFAPGYGSCTAQVIRGVEEGRQSMIADSLTRPGTKVEIKSVKTSGIACKVVDRNVFAEE